MASAPVKARERPTVDIATGPYRVASTMVKVHTDEREELCNLTSLVREFVKSSGVRTGSVMISSLHTTSAIFINEWQEALLHDVKAYLANAISKDVYYRHNDPAWSDCDRHNADSHLRFRATGRLGFRPWESRARNKPVGPTAKKKGVGGPAKSLSKRQYRQWLGRWARRLKKET